MVQKTLVEESQQHLCALKLLPCFFSKDELATSNTDRSPNKKVPRRQQTEFFENIGV